MSLTPSLKPELLVYVYMHRRRRYANRLNNNPYFIALSISLHALFARQSGAWLPSFKFLSACRASGILSPATPRERRPNYSSSGTAAISEERRDRSDSGRSAGKAFCPIGRVACAIYRDASKPDADHSGLMCRKSVSEKFSYISSITHVFRAART